MEDLLEKGERLLDVIDNALRSGDWKTDGSCDPTPAVESFRAELFSTYMTYIINAATKPSEISTESERWAAFDFHLAKAIRAIRSRGDASDISQESVDETAKGEHKVCYEIPDWKPGMVFPAPKREWGGLTTAEIIECQEEILFNTYANIEAKLKEKNNG